MSKIPSWYWPAVLAPLAASVTTALVIIRATAVSATLLRAGPFLDRAVMALSFYVAVVLLGYLLFAFSGAPRRPAAAEPLKPADR